MLSSEFSNYDLDMLNLPRSRNTVIRILAAARHSRITHGAYLSRCFGYTRLSILNSVVSDMIMSQVAKVVTNILVTIRRNWNRMKTKMTIALKEKMTTISVPYIIIVPQGILESGLSGKVFTSVRSSYVLVVFMMQMLRLPYWSMRCVPAILTLFSNTLSHLVYQALLLKPHSH